MNRFFGCLLVSSVCFSCQSTQENDRVVLKDIIDLGAVTVGQTVDFAIDILNPTQQLTKVIKVRGDCGCLTVTNYPAELKPNESGTINATYSSKLERKLAGTIYRNVVIQLNRKPFIRTVKLKVRIK